MVQSNGLRNAFDQDGCPQPLLSKMAASASAATSAVRRKAIFFKMIEILSKKSESKEGEGEEEEEEDGDEGVLIDIANTTVNVVAAAIDGFQRDQRNRTAHAVNFIEETVHRYPDVHFKEHFRMDRTTFESLCQWVIPHLAKERTLPDEKKMLSTVWLISNQESYRGVADRFGLNKGTLHRVVMTICNAIVDLRSDVMKFPSGSKLQSYAEDFQARCGMPGVVGVIDGTHIPIPGPSSHREAYINRKGYPSMQLQVVCNASLLFTDVFTGWPGSVHDSRVYRNSPLFRLLEEGNLSPQYHLLGDSAYPLSSSLLVPFRDNGHLSSVEKKFNKAHSSTRVAIERAIGLLKGKFRRLKFLDMSSVDSIPTIIFSACALHNFVLLHCGVDEEDLELDSCPMETEVISDSSSGRNASQKRMDIALLL